MNAAVQPVVPDTLAFAEPRLARALLEQWPGATVILDASFNVRWLNRCATQWLRSRAESLVTRPCHELPLPWKLDRSLLETVLQGAEKSLPPGDLVDVTGQLHSCVARLMPLALEGGAGAVLLLIGEVPEARAAVDSDSRRMRRRDLALASAQVGFWEWNIESGEASMDPEWCRLLGIDPCAGAGHREAWARNVHPDDQPEFRAHMQSLGTGEVEQIEIEYRMLTHDYRWVWLMQRGRIVEHGAQGSPRRASGICIDIDERKRSEVDLRASESRLANALWGARAALWHWNVPAKTGGHSPMWYAMTGYTEEEWHAVGKPWVERVHPDDREAVKAAARAHFEGRAQSLEYEYRIRTAVGDWRWMLDRGRIVEWDLTGSPTVVIGVSLDIHAQKEAELRLRASEARLEMVVWGAGLGLWEFDLVSGRVSWLNDWCSQFDLDPHEGEVLPWGAKIHPEDLPEFERRFAMHLADQGEGASVEFRARTRSGEWKRLLARGRIERAADGTPLRALGVCMSVDNRSP
ncbi:MAG: PAS domain-containing protein [Gammaproteobacteria bacterium]|nr:PAS domain-containing protein [Gammaproteobacteria bacterium]